MWHKWSQRGWDWSAAGYQMEHISELGREEQESEIKFKLMFYLFSPQFCKVSFFSFRGMQV